MKIIQKEPNNYQLPAELDIEGLTKKAVKIINNNIPVEFDEKNNEPERLIDEAR